MRTVVVLCEGQTEEEFINGFLVNELSHQDVMLEARVVRTSAPGRGGGLDHQRVVTQLRSMLKQRPDTFVTTFFDLYGLPSGFPGVTEANGIPDPSGKASRVERRLREEVLKGMTVRPNRLRPHVQPFEFEALVFSNVDILGELEPSWASQVGPLRKCRDAVATPEYINDGPNTHPSKRLEVLQGPRYRKTLHGPLTCEHIGLDGLREQCRHFASWLSWLESPTAG